MRRFHIIYLGGTEDFLAGKLWKINFEVACKKLHGGGKKLEVQERNHGTLGQSALTKTEGKKGVSDRETPRDLSTGETCRPPQAQGEARSDPAITLPPKSVHLLEDDSTVLPVTVIPPTPK